MKTDCFLQRTIAKIAVFNHISENNFSEVTKLRKLRFFRSGQKTLFFYCFYYFQSNNAAHQNTLLSTRLLNNYLNNRMSNEHYLIPLGHDDFEDTFVTWLDVVMDRLHMKSEPHLKHYHQEFKVLYGSHTKSRTRAVMADVDGMRHVVAKEELNSGILIYATEWILEHQLRDITHRYTKRRVKTSHQLTTVSAVRLSDIIDYTDPIPDVNLLTISI